MESGANATRVVAFDVNETLLDLRALDAAFESLLGAAEFRGQWFAQMLQLSFVGGLTNNYVDFTTAQRASLQMLAARLGHDVTESEVNEVVQQMSSLPPHPEVPEALARLAEAPIQVVALTNSTQEVAEAQLRNAGIDHAFDFAVSADSVRALKPAAASYHLVANRCGVAIGEVLLVAAHSWDVSGALAAGARAAFVARPGMVPSPLGPAPDIVEPDIARVVDRIIVELAQGVT
jgi:2-haloacid dehalogenase